MINKEMWDKICVKGRFESDYIKKHVTNKYGKKLKKEDYRQVIYTKNPINYELAKIVFDKTIKTNKLETFNS